MEALPGRPGLEDPPLRQPDARGRAGAAARGPLQRHRSHVDRGPALLPLRSRRRVQPLRLRPRQEDGEPPHRSRGLPGAGRVRGRRPRRLRAGRLPAPARPPDHDRHAPPSRGERGPGGAPAALGQGGEVDSRGEPLAHGDPRRPRVPRGDRDPAPGEGRRSQPHPQSGRARAVPRLVARRTHDRLLLRRERRVRAAHRPPGRQGRREEGAPPGRRVLHGSRVVARREAARLLGQLPLPLDRGRGHGPAAEDLEQRPLRARSRLAAGVVARFAVPRLYPEHEDLPESGLPLLARRR